MTEEYAKLKADIVRIEEKIDKLIESKAFEGVEEVSLNKAAKILHIGAETLKDMARKGIVRAMIDGERYRFKLADIKAFQSSRERRPGFTVTRTTTPPAHGITYEVPSILDIAENAFRDRMRREEEKGSQRIAKRRSKQAVSR